MKIYTVEALGWGDSESEFVAVGHFSTKAKARLKIAAITAEWIADYGDEDGLDLRVTESVLDVE